jgi:hypothetical protein
MMTPQRKTFLIQQWKAAFSRDPDKAIMQAAQCPNFPKDAYMTLLLIWAWSVDANDKITPEGLVLVRTYFNEAIREMVKSL